MSTISPLSFGINTEKNQISKVRDPLEDYYGVYSLQEIPEDIRPVIYDEEGQDVSLEGNVVNSKESPELLTGPPMDSPWPMYCHDIRHTSRSPYTTVNNDGEKKWEIRHPNDFVQSGIAIANDGTIYYISGDELNAVYPNATLKWFYDVDGWIQCCSPAIDEDGDIYLGAVSSSTKYFYAINSDGTLKWKEDLTGSIYSSPAIGNDGIIYFGCDNNNIYAYYSNNGTLKWSYKTGHVVYSSPAIGDDGTIYCGSHDTYLYALYPNNGTLKWRYKTGNWIRTSPCIADGGIIYVVSLDNYLHAVNPNGTRKWRTNVGAGTSPTIGQDGTIYAGYSNLYAINPTNGSVKWKFNVGGTMRGGTPCNSIDGTIFVGTSDGGKFIAVYPDGSERWRESIGTCETPPVIGEDGTVYIGTMGVNDGHLHAFNKLDPDAPSAPTITGKTSGTAGTEYEYTFNSTSPLARDVYYYIIWGDGSKKNWFGPFNSGEEVTVNHTWSEQGTYTIRVRAKDTENLWGPYSELQVTMPRNKSASSSLLLRFLERYPILNLLLQRLIFL